MKSLLVLSVILLFVTFFLPTSTNIVIPPSILKLLFFMVSGICVGFFYGQNDHRIWHFPYTDGFYEKNLQSGFKEKKEIWFKEIPSLNDNANTHNLWVHIIGGITGGVALYFLLSHIDFVNPSANFDKLGLIDLTFFLVAILGYSGYIPRILWFFASKGGLDAKL